MFSIFFFKDTATTEIYTLSLHDALPIYSAGDMKVVGCFDAEGGPDSTPYQIIDLTLGPR